mmetsp:Transcript_9876/g.21996  ORF Transcript_9876/g.21996 Transcript_9876/m.21996 type:complete len:222 (+) Transcript_9876:589-1254(+)
MTRGNPRIMDSAMVPGPALVMRQSEAVINSSTLSTNPFIMTSRFAVGCSFSDSWVSIFLLCPQITISWDFISSFCRLFATSTAMLPNLPTPSPPPISSTVFTRSGMPRVFLMVFLGSAAFQKEGLMGRPFIKIFPGGMPCCRAILSTSSEGTKIASARRSNHVECAEPRSVTMVTKGIRTLPGALLAFISLTMDMGISWHSGCTETTKSGSASSMARLNRL